MLATALLIALFAPVHQGNSAGNDQTARWREYRARMQEIERPGEDALKKERARSKAGLCARQGADAATATCFARETAITEQNYLTYINMIGVLLRTKPDGSLAMPETQRLPFDTAEETWRKSRQEVCTAAALRKRESYANASKSSCSLLLTWDHMEELSHLYFLLSEGTL